MLPDVLRPEDERRSRQTRNRCSSIGHPCPMTTWFARSALWEGRKPIEEGLLRIFRVGRLWETFIGGALREAGVVRQEEALEWPELELAGSMDGFVPADKTVIDGKTMGERPFDAVSKAEDLVTSETGYHRAYVPQVSLYGSHPRVQATTGLLYCVAKSTGRVKQISWPIAGALAQAELARVKANCTAINDTLKVNDSDATSASFDLAVTGPWCDGCDWAHLCPAFSPAALGWRLAPTDVAEKVQALHQIKEFTEAAEKEKKKLESALKLHWNATGPGTHVCGEYIAKVTRVEECDVPASKRAAYNRTTYKRLHAAEGEE